MGPEKTPCTKKYCSFSDTISLCDVNTILIGPFDFIDKAHNIPASQRVDTTRWTSLAALYHNNRFVIPMLYFDHIDATDALSVQNAEDNIP